MFSQTVSLHKRHSIISGIDMERGWPPVATEERTGARVGEEFRRPVESALILVLQHFLQEGIEEFCQVVLYFVGEHPDGADVPPFFIRAFPWR